MHITLFQQAYACLKTLNIVKKKKSSLTGVTSEEKKPRTMKSKTTESMAVILLSSLFLPGASVYICKIFHFILN